MKALECVHKLSVFSVTDPEPPTHKKDTVMIKFLDEKQIIFLEKAKEENKQNASLSLLPSSRGRWVVARIFSAPPQEAPEFSIH